MRPDNLFVFLVIVPLRIRYLRRLFNADFISSGLGVLMTEWRLDHNYVRFALLVTTPFLFCVSVVSTPLLALWSAYWFFHEVFFCHDNHKHFICVSQFFLLRRLATLILLRASLVLDLWHNTTRIRCITLQSSQHLTRRSIHIFLTSRSNSPFTKRVCITLCE